MAIATRVSFRGTESSPALRAHVSERVQRLERFADDIRSCHVVISSGGGHHRHGRGFDVQVRLLMRGRTIDASNSPAANRRNADAYLAVSDVFDALRRLVEDYVRQRRGDVKARA